MDDGLGKGELERVMMAGRRSTRTFAKLFFPNRFRHPFSRLHDQIFDVLDDDSIRKLLVLAPRGFGKTSIVQLAYAAKCLLYQDARYIVPISCSATQATNQTESLKRELLSNRMVRAVFGDVKGKWVGREQFGKDQWITNTGVCVMPRGSGQQVRGLLFGDYRPDRIIIDDLEDPELVRSEEQRAKYWEYLNDDVCKAIDTKDKDWRIVMLATLLHEDAVTARILRLYEEAIKEGKKPEWHVVRLSICDSNYKSNWPEAFTDEEVRKEVDEHRKKGILDSFAREYMNLPVSGETNFKREYFQYYEEGDLIKEISGGKSIENVILVDPAKTVSVSSSDSAIVVAGIDADGEVIYVRDVVAGKMYPDEMYDMVFKLAARYNVRAIGFEVTSLNEFITYPFKNEMKRRGLSYDLIELKARGKKEERIAALLPFYRQGLVKHNRAACLDLEMQLLSYPRSAMWDIMDALAYVVELLESGEKYFMPTAWGVDPEDEYKELPDDEPEMDYEREFMYG